VATSGHRWGKDGEDATVAPLSRRAAQAPAQSLACFVSEWLPAVRPSLKPSTWDSYRSNLIHHVLPRLGEIPLTEIGPTDLTRLYVELLASGRVDGTGGLSQKTVHYIHTIVHRTLRDAIRWGQLDRNAAELCDPPRQLHPEVTAWGEPEVRAFLAGMRTERLYALYLLALTTGMRRGELLGLSWDSVDVASRRLFVRHSLIAVNYTVQLSSPKTRRSRRAISLDVGTLEALAAHRVRQDHERATCDRPHEHSGLVFTRVNGAPLHPHSVSQGFERRARRLGLPRIRFHDLRHTSASLALAAGIHPKVVSERLGHASVMITLDTYSHVVRRSRTRPRHGSPRRHLLTRRADAPGRGRGTDRRARALGLAAVLPP